MAITTSFSHDYNGAEFKEILLKPVFTSPSIFETFRVMDGPEKTVNLYIMGEFAKFLKKYSGCTRTENGGAVLTDRQIESVGIDLAQSFCKDVLEGTIFEESLKT